MSHAVALQDLLRDRRLWRGDSVAPVRAQPSGHAALDAVLPGHGWPLGALSEIVYTHSGVGELSLTLPLLRQLTQAGKSAAMIRPQHLPYAPALAAAGIALSQLLVVSPHTEADALWSAEQLLHAGAGAVLLWLDRIELTASRRLQLAAETGGGIALLLRPATPASLAQGGIAALRLQINRSNRRSQVQVLKCRGLCPPGRYALGP